jgi:hypothetical protein
MKTTIILILAALCGTASAQVSETTDVNAEALFREGRKLMKDGKIAEACEKFDASERLDDSVGTLLNLADCREKNGQLATAWAMFLRASSTAHAKHDDRGAVAKTRAAALEPRLSYLTISVPEASKVDGLVIKRDGQVVDSALWNQGMPVDVGAYVISGEAPGHEPWSTRVDVRTDGMKAGVEVPRFKQLRAEIAPKVAAPTAEPAPAEHDEDETDIEAPSRFTTLRKVSIGTAVLGLVAVAGGVRYGLLAKDLDRQSNAACPGMVCGDPHALELNHTAQHDALASEVMFGIGGAAIAGAVVLWFVGAPAHATVVPTGGDGEASVSVIGSF